MPELFADAINSEIVLRLIAALIVGGLIGLERSYHGRPAGFRTHALVCLSTALLMLITVFEARWFADVATIRSVLDPTRLAQGIMTGIGFLGAGTIIKEGLTVHGLTTAASIWVTASIGILIGVGFYFPAGVATLLTLGTLSVFRWVETKVPAQFYAQLSLRFARNQIMSEPDLRKLLQSHGFTFVGLTYRANTDANTFEYQMNIRGRRAANASRLSEALMNTSILKEYKISPTGND